MKSFRNNLAKYVDIYSYLLERLNNCAVKSSDIFLNFGPRGLKCDSYNNYICCNI